MRVRISVAAREDIDRYALYIAADSPEAASRFLLGVRKSQDELDGFPRLGTEMGVRRLRVSGVRRWRVAGFSKHILVYVVRDERVDVLAVTHVARDLPRVVRAALKRPGTNDF